MPKLIFLCLLGTLLSSCALFQVHKVEVEQGNIMTPSMVSRIHPGMTEGQVKAIMGEPVLINIMNPSLKSYVYTNQIGSNPRTEKKLTLVFSRGVLQTMQREGI